MRCLAIGDIHGCFRALMTLAASVPFEPDDLIVTLGDYVDRGPDSRAVIDWLIEQHRTRAGRIVSIGGNHELMMSRARNGGLAYDSWYWCGGLATLASYAKTPGGEGSLDDVPEQHWKFIEVDVVPYFETDTHFFVHASYYPDLPLHEQPSYMLYWERFEPARRHESGKMMICGHTSQSSGLPKSLGYAACIDTRAYGEGWLTCLDVATGHYWQANQRGEVRDGWLEPSELDDD